MPINIKYLESFQESEFMHVLAKAVGNNVLFNTDDNKIYFLHQYFAYLSGYVDNLLLLPVRQSCSLAGKM